MTFRTRAGHILTDAAKDITFDGIRFHDGHKYRLHACVIMETHVHIIFQPLKNTNNSFFSLAQIMHSIKSYSAKKIKAELMYGGNIWLDESYDRIVRNEDDYVEKMNYVIYNPVKSGIVGEPGKYRWLYHREEVI